MRRRFMNINNSVPLSFEALEDGLSISFTNEILYCINGGAWETLLVGENTEEVNKGSIISFRHAKSILAVNFGVFSINKKCNVSGVCSSIIPEVLGEKYMKQALFYNLFYNCDTIVDASKLELPATTLAESCYSGMFSGCTSLTTAPELPATTLAESCYSGMFSGCTSLITAPELPSTQLVTYCYSNMFSGCTNLNYIKMLATDISALHCLNNWVLGVASTGTFVKNKDATWDVTGVDGVPTGWTVITDEQESGGDDSGLEFPIYLEFDICETEPLMGITNCTREGDELTISIYNYVISIVHQYGEIVEQGLYVSEQILSLLGIEIYIEGEKVIEILWDGYDCILRLNGVHEFIVILSNGYIYYEGML